MGTGLHIQKTIFYIFIQLVTLWSIYHQMTAAQIQNQFETIGLLILISVFFFYAYKTIKLLTHYQEKYSNEELRRGIS
jgi:cation transport ATPase